MGCLKVKLLCLWEEGESPTKQPPINQETASSLAVTIFQIRIPVKENLLLSLSSIAFPFCPVWQQVQIRTRNGHDDHKNRLDPLRDVTHRCAACQENRD